MNKQNFISSIAYCGLICKICHLSDMCDGCKSNKNRCSKHLSSSGCYQFNCCIKKKINGCWECTGFPCNKDMYSESYSPKIRAFARCIREDGIDKFAIYILDAIKRGLDIKKDGDLDLKTEREILKILRKNVLIDI
ncbi:MAG: DUF3795 domain-containing protein [Candidatus Hodarchaeota archaeon]